MSDSPMNELFHQAANALRIASKFEDPVPPIQDKIANLLKELTDIREVENRALEALKDARKVVDRLQAEVNQAQEKLEKAQEVVRQAHATADEPVKEYAKALCRALCQDIQQSLPREVRDMVWNYISTRDKVLVSDEESGKLPSYFTMKFEIVPGGKEPISHYWDPEFVGKPTFIELAENYYRKSCFHFEGRVLAIKMFLYDDTWGLGFRPGTIITNLAFYFSPRDICGKERQLKLAQIWNLFNLKYGCSIRIIVQSDAEVPGWYAGQPFNDVKRLFEDIFPVVCSLKKAGYGVKIVWNYLEPTYRVNRTSRFVTFEHLSASSFPAVREFTVERTVTADDREDSLVRWLELCAQGM